MNSGDVDDTYADLGSLSTPRSSKTKKSENLGWYERIHARYAPIRRLKHRLFEDQILVWFPSHFSLDYS
jgi:hypothetical protein